MDPAAYAQHAAVEARHYWFRGRRAIVEQVLRGLSLPFPARLVELGSGTGGNLELLSRFGAVTAIEPSDEARRHARKAAPGVRHLSSLRELDGHAFDAAFAFDVLEHLDEPARDLRALAEYLVPGAPLVVTVPAHPRLFGAHDAYLHHRRRYTADALAKHLRDGGFAVDHLTPINAGMLLPAALMRAWEALLPGERAPSTRGMTVPPSLVNDALAAVFGAERSLVRRGLPFGLSLLAVARLQGPAERTAR